MFLQFLFGHIRYGNMGLIDLNHLPDSKMLISNQSCVRFAQSFFITDTYIFLRIVKFTEVKYCQKRKPYI